MIRTEITTFIGKGIVNKGIKSLINYLLDLENKKNIKYFKHIR